MLGSLGAASHAKVGRLALYEPPVAVCRPIVTRDFLTRYRELIDSGQEETALMLFSRDVVRMAEDEIGQLRQTPVWAKQVSLGAGLWRELKTIEELRLGLDRYRTLTVPTLMVIGTESPVHPLREGPAALAAVLPPRRRRAAT